MTHRTTTCTSQAPARARATVLLSLLLPACGDTGMTPPPALVEFNTGNLDLIAQTALDAALGLGRVIGPIAGVLRPPGQDGAGGDLRSLILHQLMSLPGVSGALPATSTVTRPGPDGGSVTYTWDDADDDTRISTGDTYAMTFVGYAQGGVTLSGLATVDHLFVQGRPADAGTTWMLTARIAVQNLLVAPGPETHVLTGSTDIVLENRLTVLLLTIRLHADFAAGDSTLLPGNITISNRFTDTTTWQWGEGSVTHPDLTGTVAYTTRGPFQGFDSVPFPNAGVLEVPGRNGAKMTITAMPDFAHLRVETDLDGDGTVDDTRTISWGG
jgi:hypothetical protein